MRLWVAVFTGVTAGGGLALPATMNNAGAFTLALLMTSVAIGAARLGQVDGSGVRLPLQCPRVRRRPQSSNPLNVDCAALRSPLFLFAAAALTELLTLLALGLHLAPGLSG